MFTSFQALPSLQQISDGSLDDVEFPNVSFNVKQEIGEEFDLPTDCLEVDIIDKKSHGKNWKNGKTHTGKNRVYKKNATCKICSKIFRDSWKLKRHEKVHIKAGELPEPTEEPEEEEEEQPTEQKVDIKTPSDTNQNRWMDSESQLRDNYF